ncbi:hypothetical protein DPMN_126639 [Dreissena polymorpha]|uniref:Uncharacterized protein n=1 Tax=Dreissena polymorpha TaxID=45954 RepID=A0A9D4H0F4_DREPO|nr:hypothetical protein DPMN_126639 [Dreissena polymorpha]
MADNISSAQTTSHNILFKGVTALQRSSSDHHEQISMMEISSLADRIPLSNEEIIVEHSMEADAEPEQGTVNHYYTISDSPDGDVPVYHSE